MSLWPILLSVWGAKGSASKVDTTLVFQLPLPGEAVSLGGTGILVQAPARTSRVELVWRGASEERAMAEPQGYGFFSSRTGPLERGKWTLEAIARDSNGNVISRKSETFLSGGAAKPTDTAASKTLQSLYVSVDGGFRQGASEGQLRRLTTLESGPSGMKSGDSWSTLDRNAFYTGLVQYDARHDQFQLRARASSDLSETWGHAASPSRFSLDLRWGPWLDAHLGDQTPTWNDFLMDGSRLRGLGLGVAIPSDGVPAARLEGVVGQVRPRLDPQVRDFGNWRDTVPAQWARNLQAGHFQWGSGTPLAWNLTFVHASDDTLGVDLSLHDTLHGPAPRENLALGTELLGSFLDGRLELYAQGATAFTTDNLRRGDQFDSLSGGIGMPDFASGIFTVNLTTRGAERVTGSEEDGWGFFSDNAAFRSGARVAFPLAQAGRSRVDLRFVHVGPQFESFARTSAELARTGVEWNTTTQLARDQVVVLVSGSETVLARPGWSDLPQHSHNGSIHWMGLGGGVDAHVESGRTTSGGGTQTRLETWNAGTGLSGYRKVGEGGILWRSNYGYLQSEVANGSQELASDSAGGYRNVLGQHSGDVSLQVRPWRDLEWRGAYQIGRLDFKSAPLPGAVDFNHRAQTGASLWTFGRHLMVSEDLSLALTDGDKGIQFQSWDQTGRIQWEFAADQVLRFSERTMNTQTQNDLRLDAQWEAWF